MSKFESWLINQIEKEKRVANKGLDCSDWQTKKGLIYEKVLTKYKEFERGVRNNG